MRIKKPFNAITSINPRYTLFQLIMNTSNSLWINIVAYAINMMDSNIFAPSKIKTRINA
jgi:hypothetical protein